MADDIPKTPKKILCVDDDFDQREIYQMLFQQNGFEVSVADDGLQAYDQALNVLPDLIFTGVIMPKLDGFELIDQLRKHIATKDIPVVMFSHLGREEDRQRAAKLEKVYFMVKGFDSPAKILERIKHILGLDQKPA